MLLSDFRTVLLSGYDQTMRAVDFAPHELRSAIRAAKKADVVLTIRNDGQLRSQQVRAMLREGGRNIVIESRTA